MYFDDEGESVNGKEKYKANEKDANEIELESVP